MEPLPMPRQIPESSFLQITRACNWIPARDRPQFLQTIADELAGSEVDEGNVGRAIVQAFRTCFKAPLATEQSEPRGLKKIHAAAREG
jgi:hypothetical protein